MVAIAFGTFFTGGFSISAVPPSVFLLVLVGLAGVIFSRKKIKKHKIEQKEKE